MAFSVVSRGHPAAGLVSSMAANLERAAQLLCDVLDHHDAGGAVYEILERERVGDELARDLLTYLESDSYLEADSLIAGALAREDLQELAWVLENALDDIASAADGMRLYRLEDPPTQMSELAAKVAQATVLVRRGLVAAESGGEVRRCWIGLAHLEDEGETLAAALGQTLRDEGTASAAHWRDIVDLAEEALHGCQHAGAILVAAVLQLA